jgi:hypothetical protein
MCTVTTTNCDSSKPVKKTSTDIKGKRIITPETYENGVDKTSSRNTSSADRLTDGKGPTCSGRYSKPNAMGPVDVAFNVHRNGFNACLGGNPLSLGFLTD